MRALAVIGDEIAGGYADTRHGGWVGRVLDRSAQPVPDLVSVLTVPGETTTQLEERWAREVAPRLANASERRLVVAPGAWDVAQGVSLARTRLNLAKLLDEAADAGLSVFFVGPAPTLRGDDEAVAGLDTACYEVCQRREIPYAALFASLRQNDRWLQDLGAVDGVHPSQVGHAMIAHLVIAQGWHSWFGSEPAAG